MFVKSIGRFEYVLHHARFLIIRFFDEGIVLDTFGQRLGRD
jgi:hypothetical protein